MHTRTRSLIAKGVKIAAALGLVTSLSGCIVAMPPALQIASLALDGVSYAATGKSVTDHAISGVTNKDCAMLRPLQGENICTDKEPQYALMPDGTPAPSALAAANTVRPAHEDEEFIEFAQNTRQGAHADTAGLDLDEILSTAEIEQLEREVLDMQPASGPPDTDF